MTAILGLLVPAAGLIALIVALLRGRRAAPAPASALSGGWYPDGAGVSSYAAPDRERGFVTGFLNDDLPGCSIYIRYYPVEYDDGWNVDRRVEWVIHGEWEDAEDTLGVADDFAPNSRDEAVALARQFAEEDAADDEYGCTAVTPSGLPWDGELWPVGADR